MSAIPPTEHLYNATVVVSTSLVVFLSGFVLGIYSIRGYLISPELAEERRRNLNDPVESEESDIDDELLLDHAPNWSNGFQADVRDGLRSRPEGDDAVTQKKEAADVSEECKLVLVVRTDLGMTKGKIAAQCGHATLACYKAITRSAQKSPLSKEAKILRQWENLGQAKIALQSKSEDELMTLMATARSLGVTSQVIQDAGRTQIDPGSLTVLGVGPAPKSEIDKITGHLKLL
ncbi:Peptidyl-tRNA hydrolase 2 [Ceratocystis fimbriata CBS 114723]|uniref:peptidyl-tRNA hydrolase n=1 Tax=Ceratocystis fimbriata CBS 114723 TaxID=1035309 RepID=A0A2C5XHM4_9PEZI|nr:Peptidyl-tRNA hydrolase 2 [Ceratocystis fimbriata CBS 114723]